MLGGCSERIRAPRARSEAGRIATSSASGSSNVGSASGLFHVAGLLLLGGLPLAATAATGSSESGGKCSTDRTHSRALRVISSSPCPLAGRTVSGHERERCGGVGRATAAQRRRDGSGGAAPVKLEVATWAWVYQVSFTSYARLRRSPQRSAEERGQLLVPA